MRLVTVTSLVAVVAVILTICAVVGVEKKGSTQRVQILRATTGDAGFMASLAEVWHDPDARRFGIFVFVSMLAYSAQDLILEPFAGLVFGLTPGESTQLSGLQHGGVLAGMLFVAAAGSSALGRRLVPLRSWTVIGCLASAGGLLAIAVGGFLGSGFPLHSMVAFLGFANGVFAVAAIGSMMSLAGDGQRGREGIRMGFWGAAQAIAFGLGGFIGTAGVDLARATLGSPLIAYTCVFAAEALMFVVSAWLAAHLTRGAPRRAGRFETGSGLAMAQPGGE